MAKFDLKRGIAGLKKDAKKMPKRVVKQLPNAAALMAGGGMLGFIGKGALKVAGKAAAKKVVKKKIAKKALGKTAKKRIAKKKPKKSWREEQQDRQDWGAQAAWKQEMKNRRRK